MRESNRWTQGNQRGATPSNAPHWIEDPHDVDPSTRIVRTSPPPRPVRPSGGSQIAKLIPRPQPAPPPPEPEGGGWTVLATGAGLSAVALLGTGVVSTGVILLALLVMPPAAPEVAPSLAARPAATAAEPSAGVEVLPPLGSGSSLTAAPSRKEQRNPGGRPSGWQESLTELGATVTSWVSDAPAPAQPAVAVIELREREVPSPTGAPQRPGEPPT
ncbi:MAG: hypothetical protein ABMA64_40615, partial [Myxococcota bacterium]